MRSSHGSAVPTVPSKERQTKHYGLSEANTSVFLQHVPLLKFSCWHSNYMILPPFRLTIKIILKQNYRY